MPVTLLSDASRQRRLRAVGQALVAARGELAQTDLSNKIGFPQTTISRWERGTVDLTLEQALAAEVVLNLPLGSLAEAGGYISAAKAPSDASMTTIERLVRRCPDIDPELRQDVITVIKSYVQISQRVRRQEEIVSTNGKTRRPRSKVS